MRVLILHQEVPSDAPPDERDVLVQVDAVCAALQRKGHAVAVFPVNEDFAALESVLNEHRGAVVFNLIESLAGVDARMIEPLRILEAHGYAYTGSPATAISLANDKIAAKRAFGAASLPTPAFATLEEGSLVPPYLVKAVAEHASRGLDAAALIFEEQPGVREAIAAQSLRLERPCFAEAYIAGREFNVSLLATKESWRVLPLAEIDFSAFPAGAARFVGYAAKWDDGSFEYQHTPRVFLDERREPKLAARLCELAVQCVQALGLRGYARIDFRVDAEGQPWILEANANPCLSPDAGFAAALAQAAIAWDDAVELILQNAVH